MLLDIALDTVEVSASGDRTERQDHLDLLQVLRRHGRLIFATQQELKEFRGRLGSLPVDSRKLWLSLLEAKALAIGLANPASAPLSEISSREHLCSSWKTKIDVAGVSDAVLDALAPDQDEGICGIEVVQAWKLRSSSRLQEVQNLADADLPLGAERDELFNSYLAPMIGKLKSAVICDRFAASGLANHQAMCCKASQHTPCTCGLYWFIGRLSAAGVNLVRLIVSETDELSEVEILNAAQMLESWLVENGSSLEVELVIARKDVGRAHLHPRHFRIGSRVCVIDKGMATFDSPTLAYAVPWKYQLDPSGAKDRESRAAATAVSKVRLNRQA